MSKQTLEERVAILEAKIERLQPVQEEPAEAVKEPRGWQRIVGIFADSPGFEEGVRLGREWRESENALEDKDIS